MHWCLTVQGTQANADLLDPATYVAQAQSTVQRKRFLKNAATYASLQVGRPDLLC